jgi:hypothetical protein
MARKTGTGGGLHGLQSVRYTSSYVCFVEDLSLLADRMALILNCVYREINLQFYTHTHNLRDLPLFPGLFNCPLHTTWYVFVRTPREITDLRKVYLYFRIRNDRGLRYELSSLAPTLGSWVRIPLKAWMCRIYSVFVLSFVDSGLATCSSPVQGILATVLGLRN